MFEPIHHLMHNEAKIKQTSRLHDQRMHVELCKKGVAKGITIISLEEKTIKLYLINFTKRQLKIPVALLSIL